MWRRQYILNKYSYCLDCSGKQEMGRRKRRGQLENGDAQAAEEGQEGSWIWDSSWAGLPHVPPGPQELSKLNVVSHISKLECCLFGVVLFWLLLTHTSSQQTTLPQPPWYAVLLQRRLSSPARHMLMLEMSLLWLPHSWHMDALWYE